MAIIQLEDFKAYNGNLPKERYKNLHIYNCDNDDFRDMFIEKVIDENYKNKSKLRELLGGTKLYTIVQSTKGGIDGNEIYEICKDMFKPFVDEKMKVGRYHWWIENKPNCSAMSEINRLINLSKTCREYDCTDCNELLEILKKEFYYNEDVVKMRNLPKETRLFKTIFEGIAKRYQLNGNYEQGLAKIMDILGRRPKQYILELSTDPIDILTCSVSDNFTSCFNITRGGCNHASVNYLAIDRTTSILKLYELNDKNKVCMENGTLDYQCAVARAFVSFDVDNNKRMVLGRIYPDCKILNHDSMKTILLPLLKCEDTSKGGWVEDMLIDYGDNYVGYKDYNESGNHGYMATSNCKRIGVGDMGMIFYNPFKKSFELSSTYTLYSGSMWTLSDRSEWKLQRDIYVQPFNDSKEEMAYITIDVPI